MLRVYWGICNNYITGQSRSYPQMWQLCGIFKILMVAAWDRIRILGIPTVDGTSDTTKLVDSGEI
jgi:hypothetical protein